MQEQSAQAVGGMWRRTVSPRVEKRQGEWLVAAVMGVLALALGLQVFDVIGIGRTPLWFGLAVAGSAEFALLVWKMRASTGAGAAVGGLICLKILMRMRFDVSWRETALPELVVLFVLTYGATRFGRRRGTSLVGREREERRGRRASQVVANLGVAGLLAGSVENGLMVAGLAALAEATADTVSSEMGKALRGRTVSITTGQRVEPGTDGGVSVAGSLLGIAAAGCVAALAVMLGAVDGINGGIVFVAGCAGVLFDSLLGATLERCGWIGNDLVNFASTGFAAYVALQAVRYVAAPQPYW